MGYDRHMTVPKSTVRALLGTCLPVSFSCNRLSPPSAPHSRLERLLPRARAKVLPNLTHAMLLEAPFDVAKEILEEGFYVPRRKLSAGPQQTTGEEQGG